MDGMGIFRLWWNGDVGRVNLEKGVCVKELDEVRLVIRQGYGDNVGFGVGDVIRFDCDVD